jgi:subtilisin-like proprotein convertase family protein
MKSIKVDVDIEHTYIGDLVVTLHAPVEMGVDSVILHNRQDGATDNIKKTYDEVNTPGLAAFKDKSPQGTWTLKWLIRLNKIGERFVALRLNWGFNQTKSAGKLTPSRSGRKRRLLSVT